MHKISGLLAVSLSLGVLAGAQPVPQAAPQAAVPPSAPPPASQALPVVVNITVQSKDGRTVRGLDASSFHLTDNGVAQTVSAAHEHNALVPAAPMPKPVALPPGMFADFPSLAPDRPLNIVIVDALNTPLKDQPALYEQLQHFVNASAPNSQVAIFGLANHLVLLQDFDSDPAALRDVMDHKLIPRTAALAPRASADDKPATTSSSAVGAVELAANFQEFQAQEGALDSQLRPQLTLDAFNTLAHYLDSLPGRKNVFWFSGSFPLSLSTDPSVHPTGDLANLDQDELRQTTELLFRAQASLYPLDARALLSRAVHQASAKKAKLSADDTRFTTTPATERARMTELAADTGGKAFPDVASLSEAVSRAIEAGSNYYTLAYTPGDLQANGKPHEVTVSLTAPAPGEQLAYSHGYFAPKPEQPAAANSVVSSGTPAAPDPHGPAAAYARQAMARGAPTPDGVLFKVRVLPSASVTENKIAPGNTLDSTVSPTGPFRNFNVDYVSLLKELSLHLEPNGRRTGGVEFVVYVFDLNGRLLNAVGKEASLSLSTVTYNRVVKDAMEFHLEISVPAGQDTFLRIGMRDIPTNRFGVVEIPTSSVINLNPNELREPPLAKSVPTPAATPTPSPSKPALPATAPSTPPAPSPAPSGVPPS